MPQTLTHKFEDAPLLSLSDATALLATGKVEVSYDDDGEWTAREIQLVVKDSAEDERAIYLDNRYNREIWNAVVSGLRADIDEAVVLALAEDGIAIPDWNDEHRLSAAQLVDRIAMGAR
ncbi:hypothetical protein [Microvirga alba]|uniref:Uncharacterized protein n=1 Tax=Microvirga alba TaxID=2791025 RepID=A0A931BT31_9HYPH|nr:hypothetical protein [Microvirga alba]MBF9234705.1 hypothetical protein [Microvirga alba]